jgi:hypothetical protein
MFIKGQHFNVPGQVTTPFGEIIDYQPFDITNGADETGPDVRLCPPVNVFGGDCFKFMAVMGQASPRVKGIADDTHDPDSIEMARNADVQMRDIWLKNKIDRKWKALAYHQYATGPCYLRAVWNTDSRKYGQTSEPQIELQPGPDGIPVPQVSGYQTYANGDVELRVYSIFEVAHEYDAVDLQSCGFLKCEVMRSKWDLLDCYSKQLEQYRDSEPPDDDRTASSTTAAEARDAVVVPSGTGRQKKPGFWRFTERWLAPHLFQSIKDPLARQTIQEHFSRGLYIAKIGSVIVDIDDRAITDEWACCRVGRGEHIIERPIGADGLPVQRALDDLFGIAIETVLRAIAKTIMDSQLIDRESMNQNEAVPAEILLTAMPVDGDIAKRIFQIPPTRLSDQTLPLWKMGREIMQDISGIRPELSGGGQPTSTFREAKQRRDQALMQLAPQAAEQRFAAEEWAEIAVKMRAKFGSGTVKVQRKGAYGVQTDVADIAALKATGWHAESDDSFPLTNSDRRDALYSALKEFPPDVQQALSLLDPTNIDEVLDLIQIDGFESVLADQKEKTIADIQQLLKEQPIPGVPGPDGTPGPSQSSIPPDQYDNHMLVMNFCGAWMRSPAGRQMKTQNAMGFSNVEAFYTAHQTLATPPPPPAPPPIKGSVAFSGKMEDFPNLTNEILAGAGLTSPPPTPVPPSAPPIALAAGGPGGPSSTVSPLPSLPTSGPQSPGAIPAPGV